MNTINMYNVTLPDNEIATVYANNLRNAFEQAYNTFADVLDVTFANQIQY